MKSDYISRKKILDDIAEIGGNVGSRWTTLGVIALVSGQHGEDVEKVVRCGKCVYRDPETEICKVHGTRVSDEEYYCRDGK